MPIYEYRCADCGWEEEILQRTVEDEASRVCPSCGSTRYGKRFSVFAVSATGSGAPGHTPFPCRGGECTLSSPDASCPSGVCGCTMNDA